MNIQWTGAGSNKNNKRAKASPGAGGNDRGAHVVVNTTAGRLSFCLFFLDTYCMFGNPKIHHAYFLEGDDTAFDVLEKELKTIGHPVKANPDFLRIETDVLSIDEARMMKDLQVQKPIAGDRRIFVIETISMTVESQNALLKVFEDPTGENIFFIIAPSAHILLPTLRSRMLLVSVNSGKSKVNSLIDPKKFLSVSKARRLELLKPILDAKDDEGNKKADKQAAFVFLSGLRNELGTKNLKGLRAVSEAISFLFDRSSSVKLLLENVALSID